LKFIAHAARRVSERSAAGLDFLSLRAFNVGGDFQCVWAMDGYRKLDYEKQKS